jgi:hypothetical protein
MTRNWNMMTKVIAQAPAVTSRRSRVAPSERLGTSNSIKIGSPPLAHQPNHFHFA